MKSNHLRHLVAGTAGLAFICTAMTSTGAYAQEKTPGFNAIRNQARNNR